jgi:uncharacterized circularly permuted ATP-grasp superfamily protein
MELDAYATVGFYDEMYEGPGRPRPGAAPVHERLRSLPVEELQRWQAAAERALLTMGITFNVYGDAAGTEKIFPFDIVPRIVEAAEWAAIERGLVQRIRALNLFIADCHGDQRIFREGVVPRDLVESSQGFLPRCRGLRPPKDVWCHVTGTDLVRGGDGVFYVLEDTLRCPSGVSYVLENRAVMKQAFPQVFEAWRVRPVDVYPSRLRETLEQVAPPRTGRPEGRGEGGEPTTNGGPTVVLLTPGIYNSAYFEHSFLAQQMGIEPVEGRDLVVRDGEVQMRTTRDVRRVDVIYRRIDDTFLGPLAFRPDSLLGVPGLMDVYARGGVTLANAPGTGVADDKVIYAYVPKRIRFYLDEEPIPPDVPTYLCREPDDLAHVLDHLPELVVKAANESGGYGMLVGPASTAAQRAEFAARVRTDPRNYIAQPTVALSRAPTMVGERLEGRDVDLRPDVLRGRRVRAPGRSDARGAEEGLLGRQLVAVRREQGHLGPLRAARGRTGTEPARRTGSLNGAEQGRRRRSLDEPLRRAGGERGALRRRQSAPGARPAGPRRSHRDAAMGAARRDHGRRRLVPRALRRGHARERAPLLDLRHGVPELHRLVPARGARERAQHPRDHLLGDVGGAQQGLPPRERGRRARRRGARLAP